jgi:hypothetical protein
MIDFDTVLKFYLVAMAVYYFILAILLASTLQLYLVLFAHLSEKVDYTKLISCR